MFKFIKSAIQITILSIVFLFSTYAVIAAWSEPAGGPTGNNAATPLDVSATGQTKIGGLILNTGAAANGLIVSAGNVGIGTTNPSTRLEVQKSANDTISYANSSFLAGDRAGGLNYLSVQSLLSSPFAVSITASGGPLVLNATGGNVGIGTTNPVSALDVVSGGTTVLSMGAWTAWTPTVAGCSGDAVIHRARYMRQGKTIFFNLDVGCTSNVGTFTATFPFSSAGANDVNICSVADNGVWKVTPGTVVTLGNNILALFVDGAEGVNSWTTSGTKRSICTGLFEVQ